MPPGVQLNGNRSTFFSALIGLGVWSSNTGVQNTYNLHVDLAFKKARLGGDSSSNVTFDLTLSAAELTVLVRETEPLEILAELVPRNGISTEVRQRSVLRTANGAEANLTVGAALSLHSGEANATSNATMSAKQSVEHETELVRNTGLIKVEHSDSGPGSHTWSFESAVVGPLHGKPWDAAQQPRLSLRKSHQISYRGPEPCATICVKCKIEDLKIANIRVDGKPISKIKQLFGENHRLVAEAFIRNQLVDIGLSAGDFRNAYSDVELAFHLHDSWG